MVLFEESNWGKMRMILTNRGCYMTLRQFSNDSAVAIAVLVPQNSTSARVSIDKSPISKAKKMTRSPFYCVTWKLKTASDPILLPEGGDCVRIIPWELPLVDTGVTSPILNPFFSRTRRTSAMG